MKRNAIKYMGYALLAAIATTSCSDDFLREKKNYDNVSVDIYDNFVGANARISDIYAWALPDVNAEANWKYNSTGAADSQAKSTEEYSGFSLFVDPQNPLSVSGGTRVPDYFHNQSNNIQASVWGRIRNINDVIRGIENGSLSEAEKNQLLGQAHFLRAWCYYNLVKWYGGVPIVTVPQDPEVTAVTPRSSAKACVEFICDELDKSAEMLRAATTSGGWASSSDYGRVTSGTALALKGRVLVLWASPMFNRTNETARWEKAYQAIQASIPVLESCGHGLYQGKAENATAWATMFAVIQNKEAVFTTLYNDQKDGDGQKNNGWEHSIRPANAMGGGGKEASAMLVDLFPMADGKRPPLSETYSKLETSDLSYDSEFPFMNRDPRFYRTFAFPGVRWTFNGNPQNALNNNPYEGSSYELWNYVWYTSANDQGNVESGNSYGADNLLSNKKGIYVRKRSDDADLGTSLYSFNAEGNGFKFSSAPYMEIRYAEVLLNYAEAACGAGHMSVAVEQLQKIRERVGYTADNNYGLQADLVSDQAACMAAVLYERQIELAYEGKRFDDLRRWMLYDGGAVSVPGAPESWKLTGWGGNTCTYLGFKPLNGQRRENMEFRIQDQYGIGGTTFDSDPLKKEGSTAPARPAAVDYRQELTAQLEALKNFYSQTLVRKLKKGDARDSDKIDLYIQFQPHYYFLGLSQAAQSNSKALPQTIGWDDYNNNGAAGTFDPLAE